MLEQILQYLLNKQIQDRQNIPANRPIPHKRSVTEIPGALMGLFKQQPDPYAGSEPLFGGRTPYQQHLDDTLPVKLPQAPASPLAEAVNSTKLSTLPPSVIGGTGLVNGGGLVAQVVNRAAAAKKPQPTGPYAGNRQDSIVPPTPSVDLGGLGGAMQQPRPMDEVPRPLESKGGFGQGTLANAVNGGAQFSVPKDNLFKTLLSRLV